MFVEPSSEVKLYRGIDSTGDMRPVWNGKGSEDKQKEYFARHLVLEKTKCTYIRNEQKIKLEVPISTAYQCNYISWVNPAFENITFYAPIATPTFINPVTTQFNIGEIDWFQTLMGDPTVMFEYGKIIREGLSVESYKKAETNPYDPTIYEFQTAENLPCSKEMEIMYSGNEGDFRVFPDTSGTQVILAQIADFGYDDIDPEALEEFENYWGVIVYSDGTVKKNNTGDVFNINIEVGRGYGIYSTTIKSDFRDALIWMTKRGIDSQIIGIYQMPLLTWNLYTGLVTSDLAKFASVSPRQYQVKNKKLLLSPYQYIRVDNGEGDIKEYQFEKFAHIADGTETEAKFAYLPLFDGVPMVSLLPINYMESADPLGRYNVNERIDCHQIPQIGYTTDAYLSYVSSQYQMNVGNRTVSLGNSAQNWLGRMQERAVGDDALSGFTNGLANILRSSGSAISGGISGGLKGFAVGGAGGAAAGAAAGALPGLGSISWKNQRIEADAWSRGKMGDYNDSIFGAAKSAYIADEYHAGSSNGTLGYYLPDKRSPGTYTIIRVKLKEIILKEYDNFFSAYGYSSNRVGAPRICKYIQGSQVESDIPQFMEFNGKNQTYVKTEGMNVTHAIQEAADYIAAVFNNGCHFLKGEDLA